MEEKEQFKIICPKCKGEDVHVYNSIYDEIVIKCNNKDCEYKEGGYQ